MEALVLLVFVGLVALTWAIYRIAVVTKETRR